MTRWSARLLVSTLGLFACGDDATEPVGGATDTEDSVTAGPLCTPGEMIPCQCDNGLDGFQECVGNGYVLTACECTGNEVTTSGPTTTGPDDTTSASSTGTTSGSDTDGTGTTTGADTESGTETDGEPVCGNGRVEGDEQCDDMNNVDDDACSNACIASCGLEWVQVERTEGTFDAGSMSGAGNFIVAGLDADGQVVVSSFDTEGTQSWTQTFDLGADASVTDVAIDPNDAIVIGGENDTAGAPAIWLLKLDAAGTEQWRRTIGGGLGGDVATDSQANVLVTGWWVADQNLRLRQYSAAGDTVWTVAGDAGGGLPDFPRAVATDGDDNVLVAYEIEDAGNRTVRLRQYASDGTGPTWTVGPLLTGADLPPSRQVSGLAVDSSGNAMVAISSLGTAAADADFWVVSRASDGTERWTVSAGDLGIDGDSRQSVGIGVDAADQLGLLGSNDEGGIQIVTVRLQNDGTSICARSTAPDELGTDYGVEALGVTAQGGLMVGGASNTGGSPLPFLSRFRG